MDEPENNRLKLPFFVICLLAGAGLIVDGATTGRPVILALGLVGVVAALPPIWVIRSGRNPWWIRSPLDGPPRSDNSADDR